MTEKEAFGTVYRQLRMGAGYTLQEVADKLELFGVDVKTRAGVARVEERGSTDLLLLRAYSRIFGTSQSKLERMVNKVQRAELATK